MQNHQLAVIVFIKCKPSQVMTSLSTDNQNEFDVAAMVLHPWTASNNSKSTQQPRIDNNKNIYDLEVRLRSIFQ
jgi:hypothetical protein